MKIDEIIEAVRDEKYGNEPLSPKEKRYAEMLYRALIDLKHISQIEQDYVALPRYNGRGMPIEPLYYAVETNATKIARCSLEFIEGSRQYGDPRPDTKYYKIPRCQCGGILPEENPDNE